MKFAALILTMFLAAVSAAGQLVSIDQRSLKGKIDPTRGTAIIVEAKADGSYDYEMRTISLDELKAKLDAELDLRMIEHRRVYVVAKDEVKVSQVINVLKLGRVLGEDNFGIETVNGFGVGVAVKVKIVLDEPGPIPEKPGPLYLGVNVSKDGKYRLNSKPVTEISIVASLKSTFESRRKRKVFRQGSREVEKAVFVRLSPDTSFANLLKVLRIIESSGAIPIGFDID